MVSIGSHLSRESSDGLFLPPHSESLTKISTRGAGEVIWGGRWIRFRNQADSPSGFQAQQEERRNRKTTSSFMVNDYDDRLFLYSVKLLLGSENFTSAVTFNPLREREISIVSPGGSWRGNLRRIRDSGCS